MDLPSNTPVKGSSGLSRVGRPPQWTSSRSRKLARLYIYTTLSVENIIKIMEKDLFHPRKNSAQKTIHRMLDNDPRYLRPESRIEMDQRITSLSESPLRRIVGNATAGKPSARSKATDAMPWQERGLPSSAEVSSTSDSSRREADAASLDTSTSIRHASTSDSPSTDIRADLRRLPVAPEPSTVSEGDNTSDNDSSSAQVRAIQHRVSDCSTSYARQVSALLRDFTISTFSDIEILPPSRRPSATPSELPAQGGSLDTPFETFPEPRYAVPGDFLTAHTRNCAEFPGQTHRPGSCWCFIAQETSATDNFWLLPTGALGQRAIQVLEDPSDHNISLCDSFGNTALHLFAAHEGYREQLFGLVLASPLAWNITNSANQTFLHLLHYEWFTNISMPECHLKQLLSFISTSTPALLHVADVYGRTFFHRMYALLRDHVSLSSLAESLPAAPPQRDAFGFNPLSRSPLETEHTFSPPRRPGPGPSISSDPGPLVPDEGAFLAYHARLVQVIQSSYTDPLIEDSAGRNGLHCLAEAMLHPEAMESHRASSSTPKRKHDVSPSPSFSATLDPSNSGDETPLQFRYRHLAGILASCPPHLHEPLTNHYSLSGNTPLHAFITHLPDSAADKAKTLPKALGTLLQYGAKIEGRNSMGETPLLLAARLGRKLALGLLLDSGANVYARDVHGRGILEILDEGCITARKDVPLYARLEACRGMLTGRRDWGVVKEPGVVREWKTKAAGSVEWEE